MHSNSIVPSDYSGWSLPVYSTTLSYGLLRIAVDMIGLAIVCAIISRL
jgi:hypothetical protein